MLRLNRPSVFHEPIQEDYVPSVSPFDIVEGQYPEESREDSFEASSVEEFEALNMRECDFIDSFEICRSIVYDTAVNSIICSLSYELI